VILAHHGGSFCFDCSLLFRCSHRSPESSYSVLHNDLDVVSVG
jgi:hypothetical protein